MISETSPPASTPKSPDPNNSKPGKSSSVYLVDGWPPDGGKPPLIRRCVLTSTLWLPRLLHGKVLTKKQGEA